MNTMILANTQSDPPAIFTAIVGILLILGVLSALQFIWRQITLALGRTRQKGQERLLTVDDLKSREELARNAIEAKEKERIRIAELEVKREAEVVAEINRSANPWIVTRVRIHPELKEKLESRGMYVRKMFTGNHLVSWGEHPFNEDDFAGAQCVKSEGGGA